MQVLSLQFIQSRKLVLELVDLPDPTTPVRVEEGLGLRGINIEFDPERLYGLLQALQLLLAVLLFVRQLVAL